MSDEIQVEVEHAQSCGIHAFTPGAAVAFVHPTEDISLSRIIPLLLKAEM